jgi:hypothetical protein
MPLSISAVPVSAKQSSPGSRGPSAGRGQAGNPAPSVAPGNLWRVLDSENLRLYGDPMGSRDGSLPVSARGASARPCPGAAVR